MAVERTIFVAVSVVEMGGHSRSRVLYHRDEWMGQEESMGESLEVWDFFNLFLLGIINLLGRIFRKKIATLLQFVPPSNVDR